MSVSKRNKEATESALLASAIKVFQDVGYAKARVSDIVAAAGVSQGTFYLYFKSKKDILLRILKDFKEVTTQALDEVAGIFAGDTREEVLSSLTAFLEKMLTVHKQNIGAAEIIWREGFGHGGVFGELYADLFNYFLSIIRAKMAEAMNGGLIRREQVEEASVFLVSLFERSSFYFMVIKGEADIPRLAETMARFILCGLLPEEKIGKQQS